MEDREFLDNLYGLWAKTTGSADRYWMPEQDDSCSEPPYEPKWDLYAVNEQQERTWLGWLPSEIDADFVAGVHGALPDLIRRLHIAIDEADRLDEEKDGLVREYANLAQENQDVRAELHKCHGTIAGLHSQIGSLETGTGDLERQLETAREDADFYRDRYMEGR
jgi:hypothetical protein